MEVLKEVTKGFPQHVYVLNERGELIRYTKEGSGEVTHFDTPLKFYKSGRKFEVISKQEGYVTREGYCSCPGFKFRGKCKHIQGL